MVAPQLATLAPKGRQEVEQLHEFRRDASRQDAKSTPGWSLRLFTCMDAGGTDDGTRHTATGHYTGDIQVDWYGLRAEDTWDDSIRKGRTTDSDSSSSNSYDQEEDALRVEERSRHLASQL